MNEINAIENSWGLHRGRANKIKVQREADAIPIRGLVKSKINGRKHWNVHESRYTTISKKFPIAVDSLKYYAKNIKGSLGRAKIVRLNPGGCVYEHVDRGEYYKIRNRYHLVLQSAPGVYLRSGDEEVEMKDGELWWFDNKQMHSAYNGASIPRIHLIFDLLCY